MRSALSKLFFIVVLTTVFSGCALSYSITDPVPSSFKYDTGKKQPAVLKVVDQRVDQNFFKGSGALTKASIKLENVKDPVVWFSRNLQAEFVSRGAAVQVVAKEEVQKPDLVLDVKTYQIINYRNPGLAAGFSPWVAYHLFKGELKNGNQSFPIQAYFLYGKVPVWSMEEVKDPCINNPMNIVVRDVASKINRYALSYSASNGRIAEINNQFNEKMTAKAEDAYLAVLELGASNNPEAMKMLTQALQTEDTLVRACALSAMGTLGAENEFGLLKQKYVEYADIDRFMALKAIGDIGTPSALAFMNQVKADPKNKDEYGISYCVDLYTE